MLARLLNHITDSLLLRLTNPVVRGSQSNWSLKEVFDGLLLACPKRRRTRQAVLSRRYGNDNWIRGTKLFKPKHNIITCLECGSFHEIHTICRACYKKVEEESKQIIQEIKNMWGRSAVDKEVQVIYKGETASPTEQKRVVELERHRPLWFVPNLSQLSANPTRHIGGPVKEAESLVVKIKGDDRQTD